jgi:hypothetical protein
MLQHQTKSASHKMRPAAGSQTHCCMNDEEILFLLQKCLTYEEGGATFQVPPD